ncbi:MAG: aminotransferase class V-fold PLP-dependent enzyme [Gemmatimonadota bacterium]|nr:aminotransferase class V-fold PLP-dependent enzyme [Gemmatimonadota bacterium]
MTEDPGLTWKASTGVSRRGFLATGAAGLAGASFAGCAAASDSDVSGRRPALTRPDGVEDSAWAHIREHFILEPGTAYMNNASLGMPPASVAEAVGAGYEALSREPLQGKNELGAFIASDVVPRMAAYLGASTDEIVLTRNASEALHMGTVGIRLERGDEVLVTSQEHPAGRRPWDYRAARDGINVNTVFIPSPLESGGQAVALVEEALTPATRVIAFCHVTRGGHLYPVRQLCSLARERGIVSHVDGAQAVGMLPVDLQTLGCDTYSASLHKWLLGPMGTGVFYVRAGARDRVQSAFAPDGEGSMVAYQPPGTSSLPLRAALSASLDLAETMGPGNVAARTRYLSDYLKSRLGAMPGVTILSGPSPATSCPGSTIFEQDGVDAVEAVSLVARRDRIHIDEHQRDGHNAIRISTHVYNTTAEIDRLVDVLRGLPA